MKSKEHGSETSIKTLFQVGYFIIFVSGLTLLNLPEKKHTSLAVLSSLSWFVCSFIFSKIQTIPDDYKETQKRSIWIGIIESILAVIIAITLHFKKEIPFGVIALNVMFSAGGFANLYETIILYFFPKLSIILAKPPLDPLSELPVTTQEVIDEGRKRVGNPIAITMLVSTLGGGVVYLLRIFIFGDAILSLFFIPAGLGILLSCILSIVLPYKWQQWARASGIPEEELKAAAKLANLWWPKTKR